MKAVATLLAIPFVPLFVLPFLFFETWVAMTLWAWFAPWPLPFGLVAGVGMNLAASMIFRHSTAAKDERTTTERATALLVFYVATPLTALFAGWVLTWFVK